VTDRIRQLAAFTFHLYWRLPIEFERLNREEQARHLAMAEELLNFMRGNGWIKDEQG
jgi:hypothetical protein